MTQVETARGPVDADSLGVTLMHEHVFILNEEVRENYPEEYPDGWNEDNQVDDAITMLAGLARRGCRTIVDPTVLGLGRDIHRIRRVADGTELNIIVATGLYTYNDVPFFFTYRLPGLPGTGRADPMTTLFVRDIQDGIADSGVKAAFLKCAVDEPGMTPGVERVLRAVCRAHAETGAPITVHTHPRSGTGREVVRVLREEGADLTKVVLGHSGDTTDLDYLAELADAGCLLGMDRFGLDIITPFEQRVGTVAAMCERGYADRMVLSHDAACYIDWFPPAVVPQFAPSWNFQHLFDDVLPALRERGVTDEQIDAMLVANPRRYFGG
jgi:phosphotriesterase-related protein